MKFGLFYLLERPEGKPEAQIYRETLEQVRAAEELGFDSVWLAEHRFTRYGEMPDTMVFAAAIAASTERIRIGTAVVVLPFHNPIRLAEQVAMVDVLSGGRLDLGVGRGYQAGEYRGLGISMDESRSRFEEALDICAGLWTNETFSHDGRHFQLSEVSVVPRPLQQPFPPIWVTVMQTPASFRYAAERNYGIVSGNPYQADPAFTEGFENYQRVLGDMGRGKLAESFWALAPTFVHEDASKAASIPQVSWDSYRDAFIEHGSPAKPDGTLPEDYKAYTRWEGYRSARHENVLELPTIFVGDPAMVRDKISVQHERGINNFILWMNRGGGIEQRDVLGAMKLFADRVMPALG